METEGVGGGHRCDATLLLCATFAASSHSGPGLCGGHRVRIRLEGFAGCAHSHTTTESRTRRDRLEEIFVQIWRSLFLYMRLGFVNSYIFIL